MAERVYLCECAARDGLQHEAEFIATEDKVRLIEAFADLGFPRVEATSFSHPKYVPQFRDAEEVLRRMARRPGTHYKATCVNLKAMERAVAAVRAGAGPTEVSFIISASEAHNWKNVRRTHAEHMQEAEQMAAMAHEAGLRLVATVGTAFGCPFTGRVPMEAVLKLVDFYYRLNVRHICIGDTTGLAYPSEVERRFGTLLDRYPDVQFIAHFHDTRGVAIANAMAALRVGVRWFDSSFGGLGGHPSGIKYAEGHTGNVATEDLVFTLAEEGYDTGLDLDRVLEVSALVEEVLGRQLYARVPRSGRPWSTIRDEDVAQFLERAGAAQGGQ